MIPRVLPNAANRGVEQNLNEHANSDTQRNFDRQKRSAFNF